MLKRVGVLCACLLVASTAGAATLVTWQVNGTVTARSDRLVPPEPGVPVAPPIGTPLSATLIFEPSSAVPTFSGVPGSAGCTNVGVSGSVSIGGYSTAISSGTGYTQSGLPGTNCTASDRTEFALVVPAAPPDNPFALPTGLFILSYRDLLVQDAFPDSPTPSGLADITYLDSGGGGFTFVFDGRGELSALEQPAAVPEPGTLTLVGLGLLAAARRRKAA